MDVRVGVVARPQLPPEQLPDAARAAEAAGVDDLWLWEDSFFSGGLVTSVAALDATTTLRVGLGLMPTPLRNPALAAMEVAALSRMHPGRFVPAFGHGVREWMQQAGAAVDRPLRLLREYATAVRALLHGDEVTASGEYVRLNGVQLSLPPLPDAVPPVLLGANGPKALALAGEIADGVVLSEAANADAVASAVEIVRAARAASPLAGHTLHVVGYVEPAADPAAQALDLVAAGLTTVVFTSWDGDPDPQTLFDAAAAARTALRADGSAT
ncbi:LLM class flavin-dependent oxidoreductase [Microbacterium sp. Sa4CUA7]|uniref:LLM class flavin-dependent oxidoreductase n=2 Tax=Microbacterium pullorum TaxID=2762236 RepID=A0ABR8RYJ9_9MICO|nr:LLM class flavin-dependent oxidoreductase [Microbacterium pullorum]